MTLSNSDENLHQEFTPLQRYAAMQAAARRHDHERLTALHETDPLIDYKQPSTFPIAITWSFACLNLLVDDLDQISRYLTLVAFGFPPWYDETQVKEEPISLLRGMQATWMAFQEVCTENGLDALALIEGNPRFEGVTQMMLNIASEMKVEDPPRELVEQELHHWRMLIEELSAEWSAAPNQKD